MCVQSSEEAGAKGKLQCGDIRGERRPRAREPEGRGICRRMAMEFNAARA